MDGILCIDKPIAHTSHDVVARVRRILRERRVGHAGTLDPFATGLLVVLIGRATRLAQFLSSTEKEYEATIRFGHSTDTGDLTGTPVEPSTTATHLTEKQIDQAMVSLLGEIEQVPPMYSAKKHKGRKLYELARKGEEIERIPVRINISEFERTSSLVFNEDETVDLNVRVVCSAGTYIRTLAEDLGKVNGVGAHLTALRRTRAGRLNLDQALTLEELAQNVDDAGEGAALLSMDAAVAHLSSRELTDDEAKRVRNGMPVPAELAFENMIGAERVRLRTLNGDLLAIGEFDKKARVINPRVVLA